jgi:hypothetical protein
MGTAGKGIMSTLQRAAEDSSRIGSNVRSSTGDPLDFPLGTHLVTVRRGYLHHGIYVGEGKVVHYAGLSRSWQRGPVEEVSLEHFAAGRTVLIKPAVNARFNGAEVVRRARSRLGEDRYRVTSNNCEHFCEWCVDGEPRSEQVERWLDAPLLAVLRRFTPFARRLAADAVEDPADTVAV